MSSEIEKIPAWVKIAFTGAALLETIRIELKLRKIEKIMKEEVTTQDGEPVPPLLPATQRQIDAYKEAVQTAATTLPSDSKK